MSSFKPINFKSSWEKEQKREEIRQARNVILEKAKARYEREERKKEEAKLRGEDTWMLPSISNRLDQLYTFQEAEKVTTKKKKKHKKEKKHKRERKKKHKEASFSDDNSDSEGDQWVEKKAAGASDASVIKGPRLEREDWMMAPVDPLSLLPCVSRDEVRAKQKEIEAREQPTRPSIDELGQHERELNPYWKDGGMGLPTQAPKSKNLNPAKGVTGDGGLAWWKKAYERCVQQAKEEGVTLEEVAADRYGSLETLQNMLAAAEQKQQEDTMWDSRESGRDRYRHRSRSRSRTRSSRDRQRSRSRSRDRSCRDRHRSRSRSRGRSSRDWHRSRSRSRDRSNRGRHRSRSRSRSRSSRAECSRSRSRDRSSKDRHRNKSTDYSRRSLPSFSSSLLKGKSFKKPGEDKDSDTVESSRSSSAASWKCAPSDYRPAWRKAAFRKPQDDETPCEEKRTFRGEASPDGYAERERKMSSLRSEGQALSSPSGPRWKKPASATERTLTTATSSVAGAASKTRVDSTTSSSSSESEADEPPPKKKPPRIFTQEEMNKLGSQLVRAEIMGNQREVERIKVELEAARKAQIEAANSRPQSEQAEKAENDDDNSVVVLTRTDRQGRVRPLPTAGQHPEPHRGRRKKKAVTTHADGARERYFDDDDQHDLNTLVAREKLGTAEDQNSMFARLAGKSIEKTDDEEWQVDDVFVSRAARRQAVGREDERQKALAIQEHRKMAAALEKCPFCLDNIPKHLIVAMGIKVYMCLPNHRSLTEGHCLLVPIQHSSQGTMLDEDVWDEIQVFRKGLTQMFENRDEDCVFIETCMNLKKQPHMVMECIPMPRDVGDLAPIFFKKAIQESETEWAQNKKLIDLKGRDVRKAVPKGFPYFSVDFGLQSGFAHVIEDERTFPRYFGKEIVGGMLDTEPQLWRKPGKENFEQQRTKVLQFAEWWKDYDWTEDINKDNAD